MKALVVFVALVVAVLAFAVLTTTTNAGLLTYAGL